MRAMAESGGRSALQHSQLGLSSSMAFLTSEAAVAYVIDEPVYLFQYRSQSFRVVEVRVPLFDFGSHFENMSSSRKVADANVLPWYGNKRCYFAG